VNEWCKWLIIVSFLVAFFLGFFVGTAMPAEKTLFEQILEKVDEELEREGAEVQTRHEATTQGPGNRHRSLSFGLWVDHYAGDHTEGINNRLIVLDWYGPTIASFNNSYGKETLFLGYTWHTKKYRLVRMGNRYLWVQGNLGAGALLGYGTKHPIHYGAMSPGLYPTVNVGRGNHSVGLGVMPTFWWLSYRWEF
jgi:hypothetical protein